MISEELKTRVLTAIEKGTFCIAHPQTGIEWDDGCVDARVENMGETILEILLAKLMLDGVFEEETLSEGEITALNEETFCYPTDEGYTMDSPLWAVLTPMVLRRYGWTISSNYIYSPRESEEYMNSYFLSDDDITMCHSGRIDELNADFCERVFKKWVSDIVSGEMFTMDEDDFKKIVDSLGNVNAETDKPADTTEEQWYWDVFNAMDLDQQDVFFNRVGCGPIESIACVFHPVWQQADKLYRELTKAGIITDEECQIYNQCKKMMYSLLPYNADFGESFEWIHEGLVYPVECMFPLEDPCCGEFGFCNPMLYFNPGTVLLHAKEFNEKAQDFLKIMQEKQKKEDI